VLGPRAHNSPGTTPGNDREFQRRTALPVHPELDRASSCMWNSQAHLVGEGTRGPTRFMHTHSPESHVSPPPPRTTHHTRPFSTRLSEGGVARSSARRRFAKLVWRTVAWATLTTVGQSVCSLANRLVAPHLQQSCSLLTFVSSDRSSAVKDCTLLLLL
jgi:hypothetical protein